MLAFISLLVAPLVLVLSGLGLGEPGTAGAERRSVVEVKLGFSYMNEAQVKELWKRADAYALAEAFLRKCGAPSFVERRMRAAADPCIEKAALDRVAGYFRKKVADFGRSRSFICETPEARRLVRTVRDRINKDVEEVRTMCRNCFFC